MLRQGLLDFSTAKLQDSCEEREQVIRQILMYSGRKKAKLCMNLKFLAIVFALKCI